MLAPASSTRQTLFGQTRPRIARCAVAVALGGIAVLIGAMFSSQWSSRFPFITVYAALTMAGAWYGGLSAGLICTGICALTVIYYWLEPVHSFVIRAPEDVLDLAMFAGTCVVISVLCEQLHRSQRREAALRRQREELLQVVAHDLRNPLSTIEIGAALIEQRANPGADGDALRRQSAVVRRAARRMNALIGDLLDWTMIEAGQLSLVRTREDARDILCEVLEAHLPLAQARSIELECDPAAETAPILCDRARVLQALTNLIGNAIKFTPSGGRVTLRAERRDGLVRFSVSDTGPGITERELPMIFERYWHAAREASGGTGLGLYITKAIIDAHGGSIHVETSAGRGSTFSFNLPAPGAV